MKPLARYEQSSDSFYFDETRLAKAGIELSVLKDSNSNSSSEITFHLLVVKAIKEYFIKEKVVSFEIGDLYKNILKTSSKIVQLITNKGYFVPPPADIGKFTQEQIFEMHQKENFNPILGMLNFLGQEYTQRFAENKKK